MCNPFPLVLTNRIWQRWWEVIPWLRKVIYDSVLLGNTLSLSLLVWWRNWSYWGRSCGEELWVASRSWLWSQEAEDCCQQTARKRLRPSVLQLQEMSSAKNLSETGSGSFSSKISRWECSPTNTLIATLWDPKQKTQMNSYQTPDPQKLWNNKCVLF